MAEEGELMEVNAPQQVDKKTVIWATVAGLAIETPILGLMGFSFLTSLILLVITSPLLIIFSPLLLGAAAVFAVAMAGFGVAGITAVLGLSWFVLVYRWLIKGRNIGGVLYSGDDDAQVTTVDKMIQPAEEQSTEVAGTLDRPEMDEATKQQQQQKQDSTSSEPVTVDKMVELFESLTEHPHENETTVEHEVTIEDDEEHPHENETTVEHEVTIEDDEEEAEQHPHDKDRTSSAGYLQQNVQRQIPQET